MGTNQTTVATTAISGAVATVAVYVAGLLGADMDAAVGSAIGVLAVALAGYFVKPKAG